MNKSNVKSMTETAQKIFEAAESILEKMSAGERTQLKDLAVNVGNVVGMEPKRVLGFVNHFAHETNIAYVTRGKKGGLVKGTRPAKVVKVKRVKKVDPATDSTVTAASVDVFDSNQ
jgi:hypothetical protein